MVPGYSASEKHISAMILWINLSLQVWGWWFALQTRLSGWSKKSDWFSVSSTLFVRIGVITSNLFTNRTWNQTSPSHNTLNLLNPKQRIETVLTTFGFNNGEIIKMGLCIHYVGWYIKSILLLICLTKSKLKCLFHSFCKYLWWFCYTPSTLIIFCTTCLIRILCWKQIFITWKLRKHIIKAQAGHFMTKS